MRTIRTHISVFEHQSIRLGERINGVTFDEPKLKALQEYFGKSGVPYFSLINKGISFNEYVGVIQVGGLVIEVLPKADKADSDAEKWKRLLIGMLRAVGSFKIHAPSNSNLTTKSNSILDLYIELFINEVEYLLHTGLIKQYRKKESNATALKGSLQFSQQIQKNLIHKERFYVRHTTYDVEHKLHLILYRTICLLKQINTNANLNSRIGALFLHFPEMPSIKITELTFDRIVYNRKNNGYKKAIDIAKLLLLNYHPDVLKGRNDVLALMFDMNKLWEKFVFVSLLKDKKNSKTITGQTTKLFWKPENGYRSRMQPDIVINKDKEDCIVLDTKWKNLNGYNPSPDNLRQMYVYSEYYNAKKVALVYPGSSSQTRPGHFLDPSTCKITDKECSIITITVDFSIQSWQAAIRDILFNNFGASQE